MHDLGTGRSTARSRWLLTIFLGPTTLLGLSVWSASAAASPAPTSNSFSLSPVSPDNVAVRRSDFRYQIRPGQAVTDSVQLFNFSAQPKEFELYAANAYDTAAGVFALAPRGASKTGIGLWTQLPVADTAVPAQSSQTITFHVAVPANAPPGDYAGGLVALVVTPSSTPTASKVSLREGVAAAMYVRVAGPLHPAAMVIAVRTHLSVPSLSPVLGTSTARLGVVVHNSGNTDLTGSIQVKVTDMFGRTVKRFAQVPVPVLVPGATVTISEKPWRALPIAGPEHIYATFEALGIHAVSRTASVWVLPWGTVAGAGVLAVFAVFLLTRVVLFLSRRRTPDRRPARISVALPTHPPASPVPGPSDGHASHRGVKARHGVAVVAALMVARVVSSAKSRSSGADGPARPARPTSRVGMRTSAVHRHRRGVASGRRR